MKNTLKGVLPKAYARQNLDPISLGELIDLIGNIAIGNTKERRANILGHYVGLADEEDDFDFKERFTQLKNEFEEQLKEERQLNERITQNLAKIDLNEK